MKPLIRIKWVHQGDPATLRLAQQIRMTFEQMPGVLDSVRQTEEWSREGRTARPRLRAWRARVRQLAKQTGSPEVEQSVEAVLLHLRGELPNWDAGGSVN
jgi:hypothetical protein